jgi:hypothetical protein
MTALPDLRISMDQLLHAGSRVQYHSTLEGTNTGPGGTGNKVRISGYEEWKFSADGLIEDSLGHFDAVEYQRQLMQGFGRKQTGFGFHCSSHFSARYTRRSNRRSWLSFCTLPKNCCKPSKLSLPSIPASASARFSLAARHRSATMLAFSVVSIASRSPAAKSLLQRSAHR